MISRSLKLLTASSISSLEDRHFEGLTRHPERHRRQLVVGMDAVTSKR